MHLNMKPEQLITIRSQIDALDDQIISLLQLRMELVTTLKPFKNTLTDTEREEEILSKISSLPLRNIYLAIFETSKAILSSKLEASTNTNSEDPRININMDVSSNSTS